MRTIEKVVDESRQRVGARDSADEKVEEVNVRSPVRGLWAGRREAYRFRGTTYRQVKAACCITGPQKGYVLPASILPLLN